MGRKKKIPPIKVNPLHLTLKSYFFSYFGHTLFSTKILYRLILYTELTGGAVQQNGSP